MKRPPERDANRAHIRPYEQTGPGIRAAFAVVLLLLAAHSAASTPVADNTTAPPSPPPYAWDGFDRTGDVRRAWQQEHDELARRIAAFRPDAAPEQRLRREVLNGEALITAGDRTPTDVVYRRTRALLDYIRHLPDAPVLDDEAHALDAWYAATQNVPSPDTPSPTDDATATSSFLRLCELRRRIAFRNPLLNFDRLLFLAKDRPRRGDHHMVDQYCGFNATPGGGIYILRDPFGPAPSLRNLLTNAVVTSRGRLQDRPLVGGAFNTLELGYDGETVFFAWCECREPPEDAPWDEQPWTRREADAQRKPYYYWAPETTYHIFCVRTDGSELMQLTDGPWNDFDPCLLPNGRVAFVSERRGGYLRCGGNRPNPTYTLHVMNADGSGIAPLSYHETHEWNPSVDNHGMLVYTRWDYVDRDSDCAHHIWTCYPDGRDPRSRHGNYPVKRELRPWMELAIRAIPDSTRYIAVAAPHHGYNYGSLVLIDQAVEDDGACSQLRRITPEVPFPESEAAPGRPHAKGTHKPNAEVYGTPWPLSENVCLCVYDAGQRHYGIYLVDAFGNRELILRLPDTACLDPIPLHPRPTPPIVPDATASPGSQPRPASGIVSVVNVYDSDFEWPADRPVAALRIVQLFPKSTYHLTRPEIGLAAQSLARGVLGTVPVETDGSVCFEAPAGVPIYFQALDADGLAIQSMRSDTYLHPGEHLSCAGCHEPKHRTTSSRRAPPIALQRPPSRIVPEVDGANPLLFTRLVQPVIEQRCAECHARNRDRHAPDLSSTPGRYGWTHAYHSLRKFAWGLAGGNGSIAANGARSVPGKVGARASKLHPMLTADHHGLRLSADELHRIALWLDANSVFYGAYHDTLKQAWGLPVAPDLL